MFARAQGEPSASGAAVAVSDDSVIGLASTYSPNYLENESEFLARCHTLADAGKFQRYEYISPGYTFLIVGPKIEWYACDERGWRTKYGWNQSERFWQAGYPMEQEPLLMALTERIYKECGVKINHWILKWYADEEEQLSPPHQDKAEGVDGATADKCDMAGDAPFFVFSFCDPGDEREFTIQKGRGVPFPTGNDTQLVAEDIIWQKELTSGSLLKVSPQDNRTYFHALHKKKLPASARRGRQHGRGRFSLIGRVIKTFIPIDDATAAEVNSEQYRFVSKAQKKQGRPCPTADDYKAAAEADFEAAAARAAAAGKPWAEVSRKAHNHWAKAFAKHEGGAAAPEADGIEGGEVRHAAVLEASDGQMRPRARRAW